MSEQAVVTPAEEARGRMVPVANLVVTTFIGGVMGFAASVAWLSPTLRELNQQLALRPPVLVVDPARLAVETVPVGAGKDAVDAQFQAIQRVIERFAAAGFLVLPRQSIVSTPLDLMLQKEDLPLPPESGVEQVSPGARGRGQGDA